MTVSKIRISIHRIVSTYKSKLSLYSDDIFQITPPISGWSYSEVYSHIFDSSLLSTLAMENCVKGKGQDIPTHFVVKVILFFGAFPPAAKFKVPKKLADRVKKISRTKALDAILEFEKLLEEIYPEISNADKHCKTKHPRLGYLNAKQWLRFIEIHLKHHLKQLVRIDESFKA